MEVIHRRCAGMDLSKRDAKVCVRVAGAGRRRTVETVRTWASTTIAILALRDHLRSEQVTLVVMDATSNYVLHEGAWVKRETPGGSADVEGVVPGSVCGRPDVRRG